MGKGREKKRKIGDKKGVKGGKKILEGETIWVEERGWWGGGQSWDRA